jgi:dephospho-CoA kinase
VQRIVVIDCEEHTQVARVMARSGWSRDAVARVIAQQATRARRRAIADAVIYNEGLTRDALQAQVQALWVHWQQSAGADLAEPPARPAACETI